MLTPAQNTFYLKGRVNGSFIINDDALQSAPQQKRPEITNPGFHFVKPSAKAMEKPIESKVLQSSFLASLQQ